MSGKATPVTGDDHVRSGLALPEALDEVHTLLEEVAAAYPEVDPTDLMRLETALVELVANIIEHGRPPGEVRFQIGIKVCSDALVAYLADDALDLAPDAVDPAAHGAAGTDGTGAPEVDIWAESGRGLSLAGAIVDELVHEPNHPGNAWRLRVSRSAGS